MTGIETVLLILCVAFVVPLLGLWALPMPTEPERLIEGESDDD